MKSQRTLERMLERCLDIRHPASASRAPGAGEGNDGTVVRIRRKAILLWQSSG
jgi:hypothetical protein